MIHVKNTHRGKNFYQVVDGNLLAHGEAEAAKRPRRFVAAWPVMASSIFTRQVDYVVGEIERNGFEREICERDLFSENDIAVTVVAVESGGLLGPDG
jgi:hypothetical protein